MGLDEAIRALEVASTIAEAVPVLGIPVKAALEAASKIVDFAKAVKANKDQTKELAEKAALWVQSLVNALDETKTDRSALERLRPDVKQILAALTSIADAMEQRTKQGLAKQVFNRSKNEDELTKLRANLQDAYNRFMLSSQVRNEQAISTLLSSQTRNEHAILTVLSSQSRNEESISTLLTAADRDTLNALRPVSSAYYDSLDSPPGCLEGTRQDILAQMLAWAGELSPSMSVFWLAGLAGTGKSTIARSFCERVASTELVLASFFASRSSGDRRDPFNVVRSFAFELAIAHPQIRSHVLTAIRSPPDIIQRPMKEQIDRLLAKPLSLALHGGRPIVMVIDALDECAKIGHVEGGRLIPLLAEALRDLPVKLLVASRQETSLVGMFESLAHIPLRLHEVEKGAVEPDVRRIFDAGFAEIRRDHGLTAESQWPSEEDLQSLVRLTGRFFIFAATALRYIGDSRFKPAEQLSQVLARGATLDGEAPYAQIDALYTDILQAATCDNSGSTNTRLRRRVGNLIRTVVLLEEPLSMVSLALLMGACETDVAKDVSALAAVLLHTKDSGNPSPAIVRIFHPSLQDFLSDSQRCQDLDFLVHSAEHHHALAHHCLLTMNRFLARDICSIRNPTRPNSNIEDLTERLVQCVPGALQYACVFWPVHLTAGEYPSDLICTFLLEFCRTHLFHWIELLSLLARLPTVAEHLPTVVSWCRSSGVNADSIREASELLNDTYRMLGYYPPIHSHALHVYESAVATMPECALFATVSADTASGTRLLSARGGWTPTLRVIEGHGGDVNSVVFAPDGTQLVSGSDDRTVRLWSVRTGGPLAVLEGHNHSVNSVAFSPDGTRVVSGSHDSTLRLWDTQSFKEIAVFRTNSGAVYAVAYSTNSLIVYGSGDGTVCVWNPPADSQTFLKGHEAEVRAVAFSPDGTRVMSGSKDGMVRLSDSRTGGKLAAPEGHHDAVKFVSFSLDGTRLVSGSVDGTIQIWDMRTSESTFILQDHIDSWFPTSVAFSPDGRQVVFGSGDSTVRVWDALLKKQLAVLSGHLASVTSVAFSPDGAELASASFDETVRVWDIQAGTEAAELQRDSLDLSDEILCSLDGLYLASTAGVQARVWDMQTFSEISRLKGHNSPVTAIAFSPDGLRIVTGADDGRVRVWDTRTGRQLAVFNGHESTVSVVAFSPDGVRIISSSDDTIRVWDVKGGEQLAQFLGHIYQRSDVAFSPDGLWIVAGSLHGAIKIWDTVTGAEIVLLGKSSGSGPATNIMFSSDGHWLHTSHGEQKLTWDFQDIVTHQGATSPREVTRDAPSHPSGIGEALGPDNTDSWTHAVLSWDHWTGWLSYILDSKISVPLCWLPMERRGPAWTVIRGWMVAVGGQGGNVTMLDLTDTIERLQNLGII